MTSISKNVLNLVLLLIFAVIFFGGFAFKFEAARFAYLYGFAGMVIMILQTIFDFSPKVRKHLKFVDPVNVYEISSEPELKTEELKTEEQRADKAPKGSAKDVLLAFFWLFLIVVLLGFVSYKFVVPLVMFLMFKIAGKLSWFKSIVITAISGTFIWLLFDYILKVTF